MGKGRRRKKCKKVEGGVRKVGGKKITSVV